MGYLNTCTFNFDGVSSDQYNLAIGWTSSEDEIETGLELEIIKGEVNSVRHRANQYGVNYASVLPIDFIIFHRDMTPFTQAESRAINRWLYTETYKPLRFNSAETENITYQVICTNITDCVWNGHNGKHLTFECDSPFGYTPEQRVTINAESGEAEKNIFNMSDDGDYYPAIEIICAADYTNKVEITNVTDDEQTMTIDFANITAINDEKKITVDTSKMMVIDANNKPIPAYKLGWEITLNPDEPIQHMDKYWFHLVQGNNKVRVKGNSKIRVICQFPRKVGVV